MGGLRFRIPAAQNIKIQGAPAQSRGGMAGRADMRVAIFGPAPRGGAQKAADYSASSAATFTHSSQGVMCADFISLQSVEPILFSNSSKRSFSSFFEMSFAA